MHAKGAFLVAATEFELSNGRDLLLDAQKTSPSSGRRRGECSTWT